MFAALEPSIKVANRPPIAPPFPAGSVGVGADELGIARPGAGQKARIGLMLHRAAVRCLLLSGWPD
jgi:hypothetical protein